MNQFQQIFVSKAIFPVRGSVITAWLATHCYFIPAESVLSPALHALSSGPWIISLSQRSLQVITEFQLSPGRISVKLPRCICPGIWLWPHHQLPDPGKESKKQQQLHKMIASIINNSRIYHSSNSDSVSNSSS